jgi:hypothetical protein
MHGLKGQLRHTRPEATRGLLETSRQLFAVSVIFWTQFSGGDQRVMRVLHRSKTRAKDAANRVISSVVERFVHIEDVGGSNPSSPTTFPVLIHAPPARGRHIRREAVPVIMGRRKAFGRAGAVFPMADRGRRGALDQSFFVAVHHM